MLHTSGDMPRTPPSSVPDASCAAGSPPAHASSSDTSGAFRSATSASLCVSRRGAGCRHAASGVIAATAGGAVRAGARRTGVSAGDGGGLPRCCRCTESSRAVPRSPRAARDAAAAAAPPRRCALLGRGLLLSSVNCRHARAVLPGDTHCQLVLTTKTNVKFKETLQLSIAWHCFTGCSPMLEFVAMLAVRSSMADLRSGAGSEPCGSAGRSAGGGATGGGAAAAAVAADVLRGRTLARHGCRRARGFRRGRHAVPVHVDGPSRLPLAEHRCRVAPRRQRRVCLLFGRKPGFPRAVMANSGVLILLSADGTDVASLQQGLDVCRRLGSAMGR